MAFDAAAASALSKRRYTQRKVYQLTYELDPLWAELEKEDGMSSEGQRVAMIYATPQTRSYDPSTAYGTTYSSTKNSLVSGFLITPKDDYAQCAVSLEIVRTMKTPEQALEKAMKESDRMITTLGLSLCKGLWGNSGGARGVVGSISTTVVTLSNPNDVVNFAVGMQIQASNTDGTSGSLRDSGDYVTLTAVNQRTGELTADANWSNIASIAAGDSLFQRGDFGQGLSGVPAWIPASDPSATAFNGVDRSVAPIELGGWRYTGSGAAKVESIIQLASLIARTGGKPDRVYVSHQDFAEIIISENNRVRYNKDERVSGFKEPTISFQAASILLPRVGEAKIVPSAFVAQGTFYVLQLDTWRFHHAGSVPSMVDEDGNTWRMASDNAGFVARGAYFGDLGCYAPMYNGRGTF